MPTAELLGYLASILVAVSLTMTSLLRLRIVNLVGAACFTAYGLLIHAYPVAAVNFVIILINLYHLRQMASAKEFFRLLEVPRTSEYLAAFLRFHAQEIERFLPGVDPRPAEGQLTFFVLRDMIPAGVFAGVPRGDDGFLVRLDFVIPGYRDLKVAEFLFREHAATFKERGIRTIYSPPGTPGHEPYLRRVGFVPDAADPALLRLEL